MSAEAEQTSDFPLPAGSTQNPLRANHPRQLIIYDGDWEPSTDPDVLAGMDYLAVSYRQSDFLDKKAIEKTVRKICFKKGIQAYWIDFACTGETPEEKNEDLYRIADVFRNAKATLIVIKGEDGRPMSDGWVSWGRRIWTFPEALLSKTFIIQIGLSFVSNGETEMMLNQVANYAYGSEDQLRKLIDLYSQFGKDFSKVPDRIEMLCDAIWSRHSGPDFSVAQMLNALTAYPGEKVYALMGFLLNRIWPKSTESEDEAFKRLLDVNGLQCDQCPRIAYGPGGTRKLGVRDTKEKAEEPHILPPHVPEARFDYNRSGRRTCEIGTRVETLAKIYRWIGTGNHQAANDSILNTKPETNMLWIRGLAGSGKSTLAQTAAEECDIYHILGGSFFCSRSTTERSNYLNIFLTICYQLCRLNEEFKRQVSIIFGSDKDLNNAEAGHQLKKLIIQPLKAAGNFPPCIIVIDALDECSYSSNILTALTNHMGDLKPLKFLITSRPDYEINVAFKTFGLRHEIDYINLNDADTSLAEQDIRIVLTKQLTVIRRSHNLAESWPTEDAISQLVTQAQQLFIFITTALKFIEGKGGSDPEDRLDRLLQSQTIVSKLSPYAYLDNLYREVFRSVFEDSEIEEEFITNLQMILHILVLGSEQFSISKLADLMETQPGTVRNTLSTLQSLIAVPENNHENIRLIHSSIHDFLMDKGRCTDSRFVVNEAAGHSILARCCFRTLTRFAKTKDFQSAVHAMTTRKLFSLQNSLKKTEHSAVYYSYCYWEIHMKNSGSSKEWSKDFETFLSDQHGLLLVMDREVVAKALLDLIKPSPSELLSSLSHLPSLLFHASVFLLKESWSENPIFFYSYASKLWEVSKTLRTDYGYSNGLFGLNKKSIELEVAVIYIQNFIPETDVPELDATFFQLKKKAEEIHNLVLQQIIPKDEKLCSDLSALMIELHRQLRNEAKRIKRLDGESNHHGRTLDAHLFIWLHSMDVFNEILQYILKNSVYNLDDFFTAKFCKIFSVGDDLQRDVLQAILVASFFGPNEIFFPDLEGLQSLFHTPPDKVHIEICQISLFARALTKSVTQIQSTYPSLYSTFFNKAKCLDTPFFINPFVEHSKIAVRSLERLKLFMYTQEMQSYLTYPSEGKQCSLRNGLKFGEAGALRYAYQFWIFHIDYDGQLDDSTLQLLRDLVFNRRAVDLFVANYDAAISTLLNLVKKLLHRPSCPPDIIILLYWAAISLGNRYRPFGLNSFIINFGESIKEARELLREYFFYEDGLYNLDTDFILLPIALFHLADFHPTTYIPELEKDIWEVQNSANSVHEMLMQQAVPEDEGGCSALQDYMSTLYEDLKSSYEIFWEADWFQHEIYVRVLRAALSSWSKSLNNFRTRVHDILGISENIEPSRPLNPVTIVSPRLFGKSATATSSALPNEDDSDEIHISVSDAAPSTITSRSSSRPFSPAQIQSYVLLNGSTSRDTEVMAESHRSQIADTISIYSLGGNQNDSLADQSNEDVEEIFNSFVRLLGEEASSSNNDNAVVEFQNDSLAPPRSAISKKSPNEIGNSNRGARKGIIGKICESMCICCRSV